MFIIRRRHRETNALPPSEGMQGAQAQMHHGALHTIAQMFMQVLGRYNWRANVECQRCAHAISLAAAVGGALAPGVACVCVITPFHSLPLRRKVFWL